jgi:glycosyltransferase involved in cell wall biosynthesis
MRVLVVNHTSTVSGGEHSLLDLVDALPPRYAVTVACPEGALAGEVRRRGVAWIELPGTEASLRLHPVWTTRALLGLVRSQRRLRRIVREGRYDVVHANSVRSGMIAAALRRTPRVVFVRDVLPRRLAARVAARLALRRGARILANSRYTADAFAEQAHTREPVEVVFSPVDGSRFDPQRVDRAHARRTLGLPEDRFVAGIVGQVTPWKGHDTAVRAVAELVRRGHDVLLVIAGSPRFAAPTTRFDNLSYAEWLHRLVDEAGIADHVQFIGERGDVDVVMRALDVLLLPSWTEPFGRVVVEALTMGTRVLATDHGGPREIVRSADDGELVAPRDPGSWADALERELARPQEAPAVAKARRARALERFGVDRHVASVTGVWTRLVVGRRPERVLFVSHTGEFSGAEVVLLRLLQALPRDVAIAVACPPTGPLSDALRARGIEQLPIAGTAVSFRLHPRATSKGLLDLVRSARALRGHVRRWRPDVIHANSARAGLIAAGAAARAAPPLVVQVHDIIPVGRVGGLVRRVVARAADSVLAVSDRAATTFDEGLPAPVAKTLYVAVDHERFRPDGHDRPATRASLGVPADAPLIGQVAQITPWKGQLVAVEAFARVRDRHPDAHLVLVGQIAFSGDTARYDNAAYDRELRARVTELGLDEVVHFAGHRDDVASVMNALDLILLPSTNEPFGTVIAEAMATGTVPLVSYDGGPAEYVEDGVSGRVLDPSDPDGWAHAASELLDDAARRAAMREQALRTARRFSTDAYARACMDEYASVLRGR